MLRDLLALLAAVLAGAGAAASADTGVDRTLTDEEYSRFPRLFHLDDFEECLLKKDGVYCMGVFQLSADGRNPTFELMREYSEDTNNFNRTFLHRGYCVSARCPSPPGPVSPPLGFARCVARWGKQQGFRTRLHKLDYCVTHTQHVNKEWEMETPHRVFLWVLGLIVVMNVVGTVHDVYGVEGKKNKLLTAWSISKNWQLLMGPFPVGDPRLALLPVEAGRVIIILLAIFLHSGCIHNMLYLQNPRFTEQMSRHPILVFLQNGSSVIQYFFLVSSFLLAQGMLREKELRFTMLPKILLKRIVRISPVYLLAVGFAATWWARARSGPQWPLVEAESQVCRDNFWPLAFFVGNFAGDQACLIQTWFIGVDIQLYIVAAGLTVCLARVRRWAPHILAALFVVTCAVSAVAAHAYQWRPLMMVVGPEAVRSKFNIVSFRMFYTKPWGSLPASLAGLFMAHLLHAPGNRFNPREHKTLILLCQLCLPLLPLWTGGFGNVYRAGLSGWPAAAFLAAERPAMCLLTMPLLFGVLNGNRKKNGFLHRVFCWRVWYPLGRMSLAVLMLHWCVNATFAASRPGLYDSTPLDLLVDFIATSLFTYLLAVPVTLILDLPATQLFKAFTAPDNTNI